MTGSAHTVLAPFWSSRLRKNVLRARQCSARGGELGLLLWCPGTRRVCRYASCVSHSELEVRAEVELDSHSWVGLGFSDYGELAGADMCVLWRDWRGATRLTDVTIDQA